MTASYKWVQWNRHKIVYDVLIASAIVIYIVIFVGVGFLAYPAPGDISVPVLLMRATSTLAILLLHFILFIGPLARLSPLLSPLLYNRRHLGVAFFLLAFAHAALAVMIYGGFGVRNPMAAVVAGYDSFGSISGFPFEILGLLALLVFFVMAATSHDFWLQNLSPRVWKSIHMLVYPAYGLVLMHIVFGILRSEPSTLYVGLVIAGAGVLVLAHITAGVREWVRDARGISVKGGWVDICAVSDIEDGAAKVISLRDAERVAIFRHGESYSAVSNVCAHQGGPLGEGRVVDGCITCPWHGYQYLPESGSSPPPYSEKIPTYELRIAGDRLELNPSAKAPGTPVTPACVRSCVEEQPEEQLDV